MNSTNHRKIIGALVVSVSFHLLVIFPFRFSLTSTLDIQQVHLQASLMRPQPLVDAPKKAKQHKERADSNHSIKQLTSAKDAKYRMALAQETKAATSEQESSEATEALVLDLPVPPEYPSAALERGLEGCVLASVEVNVAGEVDNVSILAADHPGVFDQSVIDAQKAAKYAPARRGGEAIPSRVLAIATFVIKPGTQFDCPLKYLPIAQPLVRNKTP